MMSPDKWFDQWMYNQFWNFDDMIDNGADMFRWSETRVNIEGFKQTQ